MYSAMHICIACASSGKNCHSY